MKVLFLIETLSIGGIQRNALDQVYQMSDDNNPGIILVFNQFGTFSNANFVHTDSKLITSKKIDIRYVPPGIIAKIKAVLKILRYEDIDLVIDYTLIGNLIVRIAGKILRKHLLINCVVQQLASLSAPVQRYKRMVYAQFATNLFMNSINYGVDWNFYVNKNFLTKVFLGKKYEIIRNGVYLPRLEAATFNKISRQSHNVRFIFLGRLKFWKGIKNLEKIDRACFGKAYFLILASENDPKIVHELKNIFGSRITFIFGKNLDQFVPQAGDIHIYPVDYGTNAPAIESVSTNCLEMAILGVPSLVTMGGTSNWSELTDIGFVCEVNWENSDSIIQGIRSCNNLVISQLDLDKINRTIDISNNLTAHFKYVEIGI